MQCTFVSSRISPERVLVALLLCAVCIAACGTATADVDILPVIALRADDCQSTWRTPYDGLGGLSGLQYGLQKHIPITWAVITNYASIGGDISLSWAELGSYVSAAGGELASHSCSHAPLTTTQQYIDEITASRAAIETNVPGQLCRTFLQPGVWTGDAHLDTFDKLANPIGQAIQANYADSLGYLGAGWRVGNGCHLYGMSNAFSVDSQTSPTADGINETLDVIAATPGMSAVISVYGVMETGSHVDYTVPADILKALMDKLADLRDQGKIRLATIYEVLHTNYPSDLNHVPDAGFEVCDAGQDNPQSPAWTFSGSSHIATSGGKDSARYADLSPWAVVATQTLDLAPGRYEVSWDQKTHSGTGVCVGIANSMNGPSSTYPIGWAVVSNSVSDTWERRKALALIADTKPLAYLQFNPYPKASGQVGIDNVSIVSKPIDPGVSAANTISTATPTQCTVSWDSPGSPSVTTIMVRYDPKMHPNTPQEGQLFGTIACVSGTRQSITSPVTNWNNESFRYFSVFAMQSGSPNAPYSPPDLAVLTVDKTAPSTPAVTTVARSDGSVTLNWASSDSESGVFRYRYAYGTSAGLDDLVAWTYTTQLSAAFPTSQAARHVSVKAQNLFGYWSAPSDCIVSKGIMLGALSPDGSGITAEGSISAIFADCYYLQLEDRLRGMKVAGQTSHSEGAPVTVVGHMATVDGERVLIPE